MRSGSWLPILFLLVSAPAAARQPPAGPTLRVRTLVAPARPGEVPPLTLRMAAGVPTLLQLEAPLPPSTPSLSANETRLRLVSLSPGSWLLLLSTSLAEGEEVPLTLAAGGGTEPLRFTLVTRSEETDVRVRVVGAAPATEDDTTRAIAHHLLATPPARVALVWPRTVASDPGHTRARVDSVLWTGRRFFATASVRNGREGAAPWRLVQVRLRASLLDGSLLEWPAALIDGAPVRKAQRHVFTSVLPEGASHFEVALDGEDAPGSFRPLPEQGDPQP